jgi:hypothetical protein
MLIEPISGDRSNPENAMIMNPHFTSHRSPHSGCLGRSSCSVLWETGRNRRKQQGLTAEYGDQSYVVPHRIVLSNRFIEDMRNLSELEAVLPAPLL